MSMQMATLFPVERLEALLSMPFAELWLVAAIFGLTASVFATGIPGTLLPISFSSGALLGGGWGITAVGSGALIGSLVLYALLRRGTEAGLRGKYGYKLDRFNHLAAGGGLFPIIGLRLAGAPHLLVTALCALAAVGPRRYALSTLLGVLPAIVLSASAGAAL